MGPMEGGGATGPDYRQLTGEALAEAMRFRPDIPAAEARRLSGADLAKVVASRPDVAALIGGGAQ